MKTEKIEKHMRRRTVVRGQDARSTVFGVITHNDKSTPPLRVEGCIDDDRYICDYDWFNAHEVRKATDDERAAFFAWLISDDERAAFFAWLISDGTDIADGFARFGGAPRGFEEWRAAQAPKYSLGAPGCGFEEPAEATPEPAPEPAEATPEPAVPAVGWMFTPPAPKHKRGDVRVWLRSNGIGAVARVTASKDGVVAFAEYKAYDADAVFEPTPENVARLVEQQRERGVRPNAGDLVFVVRTQREVNREIGIVSWCLEERDIKITSICDGGDDEESCYYPKFHDCHILVIRRNPLREVGDV